MLIYQIDQTEMKAQFSRRGSQRKQANVGRRPKLKEQRKKKKKGSSTYQKITVIRKKITGKQNRKWKERKDE